MSTSPGGSQHALIALAFVLLCSTGTALLAFLTGALSAPGMIAAHIVATAFAASGAFVARRDPAGGGVFLVLWVLLAGALGCLTWLATLGAARRANTPGFSDWLDAQLGDEPVDGPAQLCAAIEDGRVRLEGASQVVALEDVVRGYETRAKLRALGVLAQCYEPALSGALTQALWADDPPVRVLAAGVLARLKQRHVDSIAERLAAAQASPGTADAWRALADAHLTFAHSGLLHRERLRECLDRAHDAYVLAASLAPTSESGRAALAALDAWGETTVTPSPQRASA